jgi:hypothetical protein
MNYLELEAVIFNDVDIEAMQIARQETENTIGLSKEEIEFQYHLVDNNSKTLPICLSKGDVEAITAIISEYPIKVKGKEISLCTIKIEKTNNPAGIITNSYTNVVGNPVDIVKKIQQFLTDNPD